MRRIERVDVAEAAYDVRVVRNNKVFKTHKGGKTASWSVLVVVGDGKGSVGAGLGKARGVPDAIRKAEEAARKSMITIPMIAGTLPHDVRAKMGATLVWLKPASPGTGVVAGGAVRAILEAAGLVDVLAKVFGSRNAVNCAWATMKALAQLRAPEEVARSRGLPVRELVPWMPKLEEEVGADA